MADTLDLGSSAARCAGSTPAPSTLFMRVARARKVLAVGGKRLGTHARKRAESMTASMAAE